MAYLDYDGLLYFWQKLKTLLSGKVDKVDGKQLSTNDYTTAEKNKLAGLNNYTHPTSSGNKHIPAGGASGQILRWASDGTAQWGNDNNTTYSAFKGATADADGSTGLVTAPKSANRGQYLRGDGTWATPTNTTYGTASSSSAGLMSAADKAKLDGIASGANNYTHPTSAGNKHIPAGGTSGQILRWSADGTAVWGADKDTTYSNATQSIAGLMSTTDKAKLDAFGAASSYALKSDITAMYRYKGSVTTVDKLPTTGQTVGDVYDVGDGMNYAWNGTKWDGLGQVFTIEKIKNTEIDTVLAS